ncbi:MAG: ADP-ribosylation factor-like protein [Candidatus Hodarchaeota archaeon]
MIHSVYIIKRTGECLFSRIYDKNGVDEALISGFLSALQSFISEISGDYIRTLKTGNVKFVYNLLDDLIFVFCVDLDEDEEKLRIKIDRTQSVFLNEFSDIVEGWDGSTSIFEPFKEVVDDIVTDLVKVSVIGFGGVGKTTILKLIMKEEVPVQHIPTIAVDIKDLNGIKSPAKVVMWDFAGQQRFESLWDVMIKGSDIIVVVTDSSMLNIIKTKKRIMSMIREHNPRANVVAVANKQDLPESIRPEVISELLGIPVYGIVAIDPSNRKSLLGILSNTINRWLNYS